MTDPGSSVDRVVLEGRISVEAAIEGGARTIDEILVSNPSDRRLGRLRRLATERGIALRPVGEAEIASLASGRTHGGVVALAGPRRYLPLAELLDDARAPFLVMLDGIEDPFNFGQAVRALYAAGVDGLVLRPRGWESAAGVVARASAGASEMLPTAVAETAEAAAEACRAAGLRIACAVSDPDAVPIHEANLAAPTFVLIGGEHRGITRSFVDQADLRLRIPYGRPYPHALGAATAAAVIGFEALRQRGSARS